MFSSVSGFHHRGGDPYETGLDTPIPNFITLYISFKIPAGSGQGAGRSGRALPSAQLSAGRQQVPLSSRKRAHYNRVIIADHSRRLKVFFSPLRQVFPRQVPFFPAEMENLNHQQALYADSRLLVFFQREELTEIPLDQQLALLSQDIRRFAAGAEQADAITMLLRVNETPAEVEAH